MADVGRDVDESGLFLREDLRTVYEATMASRIDFRSRIWETFTLAGVISAGLTAGVGALAGGLFAGVGGLVARPMYFVALGVGLVMSSGVIGWWTWHNLGREQSLQYQDAFTLYQIERLLGLHKQLADQVHAPPSGTTKFRWLPDAPYIFHSRHIDPMFDPERDAVHVWAKSLVDRRGFRMRVGGPIILMTAVPLLVLGIFLIYLSRDAELAPNKRLQPAAAETK